MGVSAGCGVGVSAGCGVGVSAGVWFSRLQGCGVCVVFTPIFRQILIIEGETGSGKTTQIPQYLYEAVSEISIMIPVTCLCI